MFKDKLKQLRTNKGLTQAELAKAIDVSAATIGNYEQGIREPRSNEMWKKLADYFEVSVDYLMDKSYIPMKNRALSFEEAESPQKNPFKQFRTDTPIIYDGVDITPLVFSKFGEIISVTREQRYAYMEFTSRSGHAVFARINLLKILDDIKQASVAEIISNFQEITERVEHDVVFWYKKCWLDMGDIFPKATDLDTLYDLLEKCLCVDMIATNEFYLEDVTEDFNWLRQKLH